MQCGWSGPGHYMRLLFKPKPKPSMPPALHWIVQHLTKPAGLELSLGRQGGGGRGRSGRHVFRALEVNMKAPQKPLY